jgi:DNA-binding response OmpR family regulator
MTEEIRAPLSVLVVEDHEDVAQSTAELLTLCGHNVRVAGSGPDALALASVEVPDVVLLDIGLPGMNGWEVAEQLRSQSRGKQPVVVAVTGYGSVADRWRSADAGVDLHLVKPANPTALAELLDKIRMTLKEQREASASASG